MFVIEHIAPKTIKNTKIIIIIIIILFINKK